MIKWDCNFTIENSTIQVSTAHIKINEFKNINDKCLVDIDILDEFENIIVKNYQKEYSKNYSNVDEIYEDLILDFSNSELYS